ncbi:MAG: alkaline phosphatase, partial [Planctomycetota bacterium]
ATPAGFVAHNPSRNNYEQIAQDMILDRKVDVIMGCGNPLFNDSGQSTTNTYEYVGGKAVWDGLLAGTMDFDLNGDGGIDNSVEDADGDGVSDPWTLIQERSEFLALMSGPTPKRVIGVPQVHTTLQLLRSSGVFNPNIPTLEEMTIAALNVLDDDADGLFLMVEGGAVDWASELPMSEDLRMIEEAIDLRMGDIEAEIDLRMIEAEIDFNNSVEAVVEWVELNSSWDETLLIVTGDHETGYLTGPGSGPGANWEPLVNNGAGNLPGIEWHSGSHTNSLIPFFANGVGSDLFVSYADESDSVRGAYIDNAEIAPVVFQLMNLPVATVAAVQPHGKLAITLGEVKQTALLQNYPNPFNPETWIPFKLSRHASVTINIYDTTGQLIRTLHLGNQRAGVYTTKDKAAYWNGRDSFGQSVASGVYFYTLQVERSEIPSIGAGEFRATRKMVIMK